MTATERIETIDRIIAAHHADEPVSEVVESRRLRDTKTGKTYSFSGVPYDVPADRLEGVTVGYVLRAKDGTTHGALAKTRDELCERLRVNRARTADKFRDVLNQASASDLAAQAVYWLETRPARKGVASTA